MTHMAGGFSVDLERAPEAIRDLEFALAQLKDVRQEAMSMRNVDPGSNDSVSQDAARFIGQLAWGGPRSLVDALDEGIRQLIQLIDSLKADHAAYVGAEAHNTGQFHADRS